jgi:drug/metabolite transporter (DMT)-like permease
MWLIYSLLAMSLLVARRSTEKTLADKIPSSALAWLQQATALPFMALMLPFAVWYNPFELSHNFQILILLYAFSYAINLVIYYKAVKLGDISLISPLLNLSSVFSIISSFIILDQKPSVFGISGAVLIIVGAFIVARHRKKHLSNASNNSLAIILILISSVIVGMYAPIEVTLLRETNPIYLNFLSSLITLPLITLVLIARKSRNETFSQKTIEKVVVNKTALSLIGLTMALNIFFTLHAKNIAPNAGYVTAVKGALVVPMAFIGVFFFNEHVSKHQWLGIGLIILGLSSFLLT